MYAYIKGKIADMSPTHVVLDAHGVGYFLNISLYTYQLIAGKPDVLLYVHLIVREDAHILHGFFDEDEKSLFLHLVSVSGVGPNTARTILSYATPAEIRQLIASGQAGLIQKIKGIGPKTAQRIVVELKDKMLGKNVNLTPQSIGSGNNLREEALAALAVLGYARAQSEKVVDKIIIASQGIKLEDLIRAALKSL
jgi:Holliday junction DNA helicase RuvA